ncbi:aldehyde dehydrogenase family protein [Streptomyces sp. V4-01]|uniref:Aldehyde dehydrogenase family protein n=1 Tax=Actinacidiphila polyblastidii TaxID=3110430 RepID=A0ABU7P9X1_9ACTN|nr:aldehyde dehydrogenase family protein [Streptomyces sp. V4-01]
MGHQLQQARHWIDGEWTDSQSPGSPSTDPATGEQIGTYTDGGKAVAEAAIQAAVAAFETGAWREDAMLRATALHRLADAYEARTDDLIDTLCLENGKLRGEAAYEVHFIPRALRFAAGLALHSFGRVTGTKPGQQSMSIRQPVGVAGIITPWNSPAYLSVRSLAPALAAGCAAVVKMPAQAAQTARVMSEIIASVAELPRGLVNIFIESGSEGARHLVGSPRVPVISYTGSTAVGRVILADAAASLKRVGAELGGKTPHLIFADADFDTALETVVASCTVFAGQFCMTGSRVLVHDAIADRFLEALARRLDQVRPGPAADPASEIGPMIDKASVSRVDALVEDALAAGAKPLVRGGPATDPALAGGAFYRPTLLEVTDSSLPIVQQEVFGPVQVAQRFSTEDEAVALANATEYGLSACVWSRDADRPLRVARRLDAGLISVNSWANLAVETEEGGWKASGLGRLGGVASIDDFTEYKQITQNHG